MGVERSEDVAQAVVARRAVREGQKALQKGELLLPEPSHVGEPLGARQDRHESQQQNLVEPIGHLARLPMVRHVFEIIEKNSGLEIPRRRRRQNIHRPAPLTNQRMPTDSALQPFVTNFLHPIAQTAGRRSGGVDLDSFFGPVRVEWDHEAALTPLGQLPFFIHFLKAGGLFDALVADCPLRYLSPNAPEQAGRSRDTVMLSMLAGHRALRAYRGAALRRRAAGALGDEEDRQRGRDPARLQGDRRDGRRRLAAPDTCNIVSSRCWPSLGFSTSIRRSSRFTAMRQGAVLGYNPKKPGRPSHCYHTYSMASTRLVLDVDVCPGDEHASQARRGQACGRCSIVCRATYGPRFCGAIAASATRGSCARRRRGSLPFSSSCA